MLPHDISWNCSPETLTRWPVYWQKPSSACSDIALGSGMKVTKFFVKTERVNRGLGNGHRPLVIVGSARLNALKTVHKVGGNPAQL